MSSTLFGIYFGNLLCFVYLIIKAFPFMFIAFTLYYYVAY